MYFWQIKVFIGCKNASVGCIYGSTSFFGCINVRRQQFFANNTATVNPLVVKMAASLIIPLPFPATSRNLLMPSRQLYVPNCSTMTLASENSRPILV